MSIDLRGLNDRLHVWWNNLLNSQREHLPENYDAELLRDGSILCLREKGINYYFGFDRASPNEQITFREEQIQKLKSNTRMEDTVRERKIRKIEFSQFVFFAGTSLLPYTEKDLLLAEAKRASDSMEKGQRIEFRGVYGIPTVMRDVINFDEREYEVLTLRGVVENILLGDKGGLSENLFFLGRRGIFSPIVQAVSAYRTPGYARRNIT